MSAAGSAKIDIRSVLALYKKLMRYSNSLKYTDKDFYLRRVRTEFQKNRELTDLDQVNFQYQLSMSAWSLSLPICLRRNFYRNFSTSKLLGTLRKKEFIDKSKVPVLKEAELEETFIKGGGPGGSNINKTVSCVSLKHLPTGIVIKCQFSRLLQENRVIARERLVERLDDFYNGDMSLKAQRERILSRKLQESTRKSQNLNELKRKYKEHLNSAGSPSPNQLPESENQSGEPYRG